VIQKSLTVFITAVLANSFFRTFSQTYVTENLQQDVVDRVSAS